MKAVAIVFAFALAGCQSVANLPPGTPKSVIVKTVVDEKLGAAAAALSNYCVLMKASLAVAPLVISNGGVAALVHRKLTAAVNSYCGDLPPRNIEEALIVIARIYRETMEAAPELKAYHDGA